MKSSGLEFKIDRQDGLRTPVFIALLTGLFLVSAILRWLSYVNVPLWLDEAWRANIILSISRIRDFFIPRNKRCVCHPCYLGY